MTIYLTMALRGLIYCLLAIPSLAVLLLLSPLLLIPEKKPREGYGDCELRLAETARRVHLTGKPV